MRRLKVPSPSRIVAPALGADHVLARGEEPEPVVAVDGVGEVGGEVGAQPARGGRRPERVLELAPQQPLAAEGEQPAPGSVADVDRPLGALGDDPVHSLDGLRREVAGQVLREPHPRRGRARVDLRPLRRRRHREHVVDPELAGEGVDRVGIDALVLDHRDPVAPEPVQRPRPAQLPSQQRGRHALARQRVVEDDGVEIDLAQPGGWAPGGDVEVEVAAPPVAAERVEVVADRRPQRVLEQAIDDQVVGAALGHAPM